MTFKRAARLALAATAALTLAACQGRTGGENDAAFGARVRAYLLAHPEVLQEVAQRLDAKQAADERAQAERDKARAEALLPQLRPAIERDSADFVANPAGAVTVTEFYDYRCPHCVDAAPAVVALVHANPDVRFVFKEMPIFGPVSEHAARAALAVRKAGGDGLGLYAAFMAARPLTDQTIDQIARAKGARAQDLGGAFADEANRHIAQTGALFTRLGLGGTPAFIIGDQVILGADLPAVQAALTKAKAKRA